MIILGIDPGLSGALALVRDGVLLNVADMPTEPVGGAAKVKNRISAIGLRAQLSFWRSNYDDAFMAVVERVQSGSGQGVASVFSLGDTAGCIRAVLQLASIRIEYVTPAAWKKAMRVPADKGVARTMAIQRWPDQAHLFARVMDHNRAEAALIAMHGWEEFA